MCRKKTILITLFLCLAGSMTGFADVIVYENDFEDPCQVDALSGWNWGDGGIAHNVAYVDYEGNTVVEHTGIIDATAAALTTRFGSKWGITLSGNTSSDPADYTIEFDLRSVSGDWDPIDLEFFVLTGGGNGVGYGSGASSYAQADGWVHVTANLADLSVGWWAGQAWDMTDPNWQIEVGGPPWPGTSVPAGTPAWDQIWLMDNLKITMISLVEPVDPGTEGLVAAYAFENDVNDSSGNGLNGTIVGDPNFVEGIAGMALDFNGDDYVDCGNDERFSVTEYLTVALWVNIRSIPTAWTGAITKGNTAWRISNYNTTQRMHFGFENGSRGWQAANSETELNAGEWYHVCGVYDINVGAKIYINGVEDGNNPDTGGITQNTSIVAIGTNSDSTYPEQAWDGLLDEVMIYNRALSEGEVMYLAGMRPTPVDPGTDGLVAYYAMENDVNDSSGNGLNGTIFGDPNFVAGYEGMALDLDGVGDYVDCGYDPLFDVLTNEITVSAWVTIRSIANQWAAIAAKGEYAWRLGNASLDPRFHFGITIWSAPDTASLDGVTAVGYDEWHHAAGVFDGSNIMVYLDGALDVSVATTEPIGINDKSMFIGDNPDATGRYWDGLIDELKIYDRALSAGELRYLAGFRPPVVPVHSYTFEDGTANDSVGDAHGTLVGGAEIVDGAMVTTAQDQWMEMPGDVIAMGTYPEVTIEAWYTPTAGANTGWSMLAYFGDSATGLGNDGYFITSARGDDKSRAAISCGNTSAPYSVESGADGPEYDDGLLHHMVSTLNATDITLYIDGVLMQSTPLSATNSISCISPNFAYLAKGGYNDDPEWIGAIEEFNIYDVALSEAEVAARYAAGPQ